MSNGEGSDFDSARAELFEALSHPNRIRILKALSGEALGFSELRRAVGMESSGLLSFHLQKLTHLVKTTPEGAYALTDEGKEALRMAETIRHDDSSLRGKKFTHNLTLGRAIMAALLIGIIVIGAVAFYQQEQIGSLNHSLSSEQAGSVLINGTRYWQLSVPLQSMNFPAIIQFNGVIFNATAPPIVNSTTFLVVSNSTLSQYQCPCMLRVIPLPNIQVRFADGQTESDSFVTPAWFTHHSGPRAGVYLNTATSSLDLYVSTGT